MTSLPLTIKETLQGLRFKKFSALELVEAYLKQIKRYNEEYNIFLTLSEEKAYLKAKELDKYGKFDEPLSGVIVSYKDIFLTEGVRTTAGSKVLEGYVPSYSATAVKRLENAGAIALGKLNCDAWAHGASGENSDFGPTLNPWNKKYVPGGSSSGSAAALAANMSIAALGSDTGGSIRQPAGFCYCLGLKPTRGAISRYGVIAMSSSIDTVGPLARSVEDIEILFDVLKGQDGFDSTVINADYKKKKINSQFKLGIVKEYFNSNLNAEIEAMIDQVISIYKKMGIEIVEVSLPRIKYAVPVYYIIQPAEVASNLARYDGIRFGNGRKFFTAEAKRRIMLGNYVLSAGYYDAYYLKAQKVRSLLINDFKNVFQKVDALLSPVSPAPPFLLGQNSEDPLKMYFEDIYTASANLAGIPSLALPFGFSNKGLPIGFQLMGNHFSEYLLFELGKRYHREIDYKPKIAL